ncbi:hypothetical protein [Hyphomicrobium sulfonivorans]|uniref:Uncharacterized protein n=1 Tax=Hyphomicrobium sulfonivorans TaxID=121290 RepID=A0A109BF01_HYPSL|nr:hypothetical protein [Hyphomicrobium sulfonivorans]KWT67531.1 hypothetical protein APY04_1890 [Hyphomicrobium sulfonivorans]MBI1649368.1 hypothetical protein [Hyphomicrobium sulfonivorans]NSL71286.1 hypothetical protein [Hyphomicrobium sulfonivorans]
MWNPQRSYSARFLLAALYGLVLLAVPLAHRPSRPTGPDFTAYALPDGSLPSICTRSDNDNNTPPRASLASLHSTQRTLCDAFVLLSTPTALSTIANVIPPVATRYVRNAASHRTGATHRFEVIAQPRAPPPDLA